MRCPFLREAQVKYCQASAFRKMIVRRPEETASERCSSPEYVNCPAAKQHHEEQPSLSHCPFLHESLVQYCAATSVTKYIPYSEAALSHCGNESHKYCELFLALANPGGTGLHSVAGHPQDPQDARNQDFLVDEVHMPGRLWYSANHMWLDANSDGLVHIGVDAFFARILGSIEQLSFITARGLHHPTVVFTVQGVDAQLVFPWAVNITKNNAYLRTNPSKLLAHPYTLGWLFEGTLPKEKSGHPSGSFFDGLVTGKAAVEWMTTELQRITHLVHHLSHQPDAIGEQLMADGGTAQPGVIQHLSRDQKLHLFHEFFSPLANRR